MEEQKPKLNISVSREHADRKEGIKKVFGDFDVEFNGDLYRFSAEEMAMQVIVFLTGAFVGGAAWDLFKLGIQKFYKKYKNAQIIIEDVDSIKYAIKPDLSVVVIIVPDRAKEFENVRTIDDLVEHFRKWTYMKLGDLAKITSGGTPNRKKSEYWNGDIPWVTTAEIDFNTIYSAKEKITKDGLENSSAKLFKRGTLLMAMYGQGKTRGKIAQLGIEAASNQACCAIIFDELNSSRFYFYYLKSQYNQIRELSNDGGQKNLSANIIKSFRVPYVDSNEKERIVKALETWDAAIEKLERIIALKREVKKGLMQKLLTGEIRLPGFTGEWINTELISVAELRKEKFNPQTSENKRCIELEHLQKETPKLLGWVDAIGQKSIKNVFKKNDILFGKLRPYLKKIYKPDFDGVCSTEIWVLKAKDGIDQSFLYHLVQTHKFINAANVSSGSRMPRSDWGFMKSRVFFIPESLEEQRFIAKVFESVDKEISLLENKKSILSEQKKYLLNNLVTGNIRTPENL